MNFTLSFGEGLGVRSNTRCMLGFLQPPCVANYKYTHLALYAVMDSIVDQYFPVVEELQEGLQQIEEKVFKEKPTRQTTEDIYQLKRELLDVKRAVSPLIDIASRLMWFDTALISEET